jgi:hypothetical protein
MKTRFTLLSALLATSGLALAAPLGSSTAVHTQPNESSPVIKVLSAGSEPAAAMGAAMADTPAGWMAVELSGPFDGYVLNKDILKSLDVRDGAQIHQAPKPESGVITTMAKGDKSNITGLHGKWTQVSVEKKITGYIRLNGASSAPAPAPVSVASSTPPPAPAPVSPVAYGVTTAGQPVAMVNLGDGGSSALPRLVQGKFVSTHSAFRPRRPYDWALDDDAGVRYAYLDVSKLLLTEQLDKYIDHHVVVYGAAKSVPNSKDIVIVVESLQLR